ncbi:MAG: hypothetical protein WCC87_10550 [Candidatus Korobacteraceae bacterium]
MMTFLVSSLFLLTIVGSFAFGILAAYWVIREFLNFFDPSRPGKKPSTSAALAPTASGD